MRRALVGAVLLALALALPASALGKQTADFTFKSSGKAATPGAVAGLGAAGTYEDIPFTIAPDDADGTATIYIQWDRGTDDFDLYVYKKNASGGLDQVGSSAGGPPNTSETVVLTAQKGPIAPGDYVIRVQNYASTTPDFSGYAKFGPFVVPNAPPAAVLSAPSSSISGVPVTLDGSRSSDSDGHIVSYSWDLDGDGAMDVTSPLPTLTRPLYTGVHHITLKVVDDRGGRAYANATVRVTPATLSPSLRVSGFALSPRALKPGKRAWFRWKQTRAAAVLITLQRKVGKRGYRGAGSLTGSGGRGANALAFMGFAGKRKLARGSYRATIVATDSGGGRSKAAHATFRIR